MKSKLKLSTIILSLVCLVVLVSILMTDLLISSTINSNVRGSLEERAMILAKIVANSKVVQNGLKSGGDEAAIQAYATEIQEASNVLFVVVMDMDGIRKSHPIPERIGGKFSTKDHKDVLKGKQYVSISQGTMGKSLKAFTPIYDQNKIQIGAVAVGISLKKVDDALQQARRNIVISTILGLLVGVIGAYVVATYIKRILFGLEPNAIAKIHEERNTMLHSVHEGIIAVDQDLKITLVNKTAAHLFTKAGLNGYPVGKRIDEYIPSFQLENVLKHGVAELDEELTINGLAIVVNKVPLIVNKETVGAISTFRDKTEMKMLAIQLTGVKLYAEALRTQSHEFMNKLHVILGMIQMEMYKELSEYINTLVHTQNHEISYVTKNIKDPALAGFIIGKLSYAREANVTLSLEAKSVIPKPENNETVHELITILGNLINNAIEALVDSLLREIYITLNYVDHLLEINISDTGPGISKEIEEHVFEKGFSTKGENRGFGLYLVKRSVESLGGKIIFNSNGNGGVTINIEIPYETTD